MKMLVQYLAVGAAGCLGAMFRYFVGSTAGRMFGTDFPVGTFVINITGSLFLGWFAAAVPGRVIVSDTMKLAIGVGFVGAYTTFSTFMLESNSLLRDGEEIKATINLIGSLVLGLIAVRVGIWLGTR